MAGNHCGFEDCPFHGGVEQKLKTLEKVQDQHALDRKDTVEAIWGGINKKADSWIVKLLVLVILGFAAFQWSTYSEVTKTNNSMVEIKAILDTKSKTDEKIFDHLMELTK